MRLRDRTALLISGALGFALGAALIAPAAFDAQVSDTSTFASASDFSPPVLAGYRITTDSACGVGRGNASTSRLRQGDTVYACLGSATDNGSIVDVHADLSAFVDGGEEVAMTAGSWQSGAYTRRTAGQVVKSPIATGTSLPWTVTAVDNADLTTTSAPQSANIQSLSGYLLGEFGFAGVSNLVQYYRLDEITGTSAEDAHTPSEAGTFVGTPALGLPGGLITSSANFAVGLDAGSQQAINAIVNHSPSISYAMRFRTTAGAGVDVATSMRLISSEGPSAGTYATGITADGRVCSSATGSGQACSATTGYNDGQWHTLVVLNRSGTTFTPGYVRTYVDGVQVTGASRTNNGAMNGNAVRIGAHGTNASDFFTGEIDEFVFLGSYTGLDPVAFHRLAASIGG